MRKITCYLGFIILLFTSCNIKTQKTVLTFTDIEVFPQEIIVYQSTENFVAKTDTFHIQNEKNTNIALNIDRPQTISVQKEGEFIQLFVEPDSKLSLSKKDDHYLITGDLEGANTYLQESRYNKELREKGWDYSANFDQFKKQTSDYFKFSKELLDKYVIEDSSYFYRLTMVENRVRENNVILDYILTQSPAAERDSLFFAYFDTNLLDIKYTTDYIESGGLRSFYSNKGVEYFARKKYGDKLDSVQKNKEYFAFRGDLISEYFDQPIKSILIYSDLKYYPEEYDYLSDSLRSRFTEPRKLVERYKEDLHEEAYTDLHQIIEDYKAVKNRYAKGKAVPDFLLKNESNQEYKFKSADFKKLTLVDTWASWCGPCITGFPKVKEIEQKYADQLDVVSISIDKNFENYKEGITKHELPGYLKLYAEDGFTSDYAKHFKINAIPRYLLISETGEVVDANLNLDDLPSILQTEM